MGGGNFGHTEVNGQNFFSLFYLRAAITSVCFKKEPARKIKKENSYLMKRNKKMIELDVRSIINNFTAQGLVD